MLDNKVIFAIRFDILTDGIGQESRSLATINGDEVLIERAGLALFHDYRVLADRLISRNGIGRIYLIGEHVVGNSDRIDEGRIGRINRQIEIGIDIAPILILRGDVIRLVLRVRLGQVPIAERIAFTLTDRSINSLRLRFRLRSEREFINGVATGALAYCQTCISTVFSHERQILLLDREAIVLIVISLASVVA